MAKQANGKWRKGFAAISPERQRELASRGGIAAHKQGTAHEWTSDEAREAGRKGGKATKAETAQEGEA